MAIELRGRQDRLLRGPMWSGQPKQDWGDPSKARANIACVSQKSVAARLAKDDDFSTDPVIQVHDNDIF